MERITVKTGDGRSRQRGFTLMELLIVVTLIVVIAIVMSEPDPGNPSAAPGVYDVKSGAPGVSLDGTPYADFQ
jgi:prepilin-type N-terminal cleavage/methylation domain-containing protein